MRIGIVDSIHDFLHKGRVPLDWGSILALAPLSQKRDTISLARKYLTLNFVARRDWIKMNQDNKNFAQLKVTILPEYLLPSLVHLCSHWDWDLKETEGLEECTKVLYFFIDMVWKDNSGLLIKIFEALQMTQDTQDPENDVGLNNSITFISLFPRLKIENSNNNSTWITYH